MGKITKKILCLLTISACMAMTFACSNATTTSDKEILIIGKTAQYFTDEAVPSGDITNILNAGINATSAMNKQDWHFSAVTDKVLLNEFKENMSKNMPPQMKDQPNPKAGLGDTPLAIVVSCGVKGDYDAGLATQSMYDYAVLSGYGAKILSSPCKMINENYKQKLGIPNGMNSVAVIIIGKVRDMNGVDGVTSASLRKSFDEVVTIIK